MVAVFGVLAEPNRRRIPEELRGGELTVTDVVVRLDISQPTVSRHLRVRRQAGLVTVRVDRQRRQYRLRAEVDAWVAQFRPFWNERLDALERYLDKENPEGMGPGTRCLEKGCGDIPSRGIWIYLTGSFRPLQRRARHCRNGRITMSANQTEAEITRASDGGRIRFERTFPHHIEKVWAALTERDRLAEWIGPGEIELRPGGAIRIVSSGVEPPAVLASIVDEIDPPRLLQFRFDDGVGDDNMLRIELTEHGDTTHFVLTQIWVPSDRDLADNAAGWHVRIDMLGTSLDDGRQELAWDKIGQLNTHYTELIATLSLATP